MKTQLSSIIPNHALNGSNNDNSSSYESTTTGSQNILPITLLISTHGNTACLI